MFVTAPEKSTLRGSALLAELTVNRTLPRPLTDHERLGGEQRHAAALLYQLPIALPSREEPAGGERADVGKGTEVLVGNVNDYSRRLHLARIGGQLEQYLSEPRRSTLGDEVGMPLHVHSDIMHRQAEAVLDKLGMCFCEPADRAVVPDQEFAF